MTIREIAELCGVKVTDTIRNWINREDFLNCKMQLRNQIKEKLAQGSPEMVKQLILPYCFYSVYTVLLVSEGFQEYMVLPVCRQRGHFDWRFE